MTWGSWQRWRGYEKTVHLHLHQIKTFDNGGKVMETLQEAVQIMAIIILVVIFGICTFCGHIGGQDEGN